MTAIVRMAVMTAGGVLLAGMATAAPAQTANTRVLTIYGSDPCPTSSNNEEIVVCRRLPETERFRIPLDIRDPSTNPEATAGAIRNERIVSGENGERSGVGSCSPVGPGGMIGCNTQLQNRARAERKANGERTGIKF